MLDIHPFHDDPSVLCVKSIRRPRNNSWRVWVVVVVVPAISVGMIHSSLFLVVFGMVCGFLGIVYTLKGQQAHEECILVFPDGIQIEYGQEKQYFPFSAIHSLFLNEGFENCHVVLSLLLIVNHHEPVVLWNRIRLPPHELMQAFAILDRYIKQSPSYSLFMLFTHPGQYHDSGASVNPTQLK